MIPNYKDNGLYIAFSGSQAISPVIKLSNIYNGAGNICPGNTDQADTVFTFAKKQIKEEISNILPTKYSFNLISFTRKVSITKNIMNRLPNGVSFASGSIINPYQTPDATTASSISINNVEENESNSNSTIESSTLNKTQLYIGIACGSVAFVALAIISVILVVKKLINNGYSGFSNVEVAEEVTIAAKVQPLWSNHKS